MTGGALDGVRVLDLSRVLAGPMCAMWLGDMGADVVKVERPGTGDDTRTWGPPFAGTEAAYYLCANRNKRSLTLDLSLPRGREILAELIRGADVVLDNFKIGTLKRWGFDDDWYANEAPTAVRATISGYGSTGPKAAMPGYDFILQAETGLMAVTGEPDGESMKHGVALVDVCTGMLTAISVLGALVARGRTGKGQRIEASLHDTGIAMLANVAANHLVSGTEAARYGNGHPNIVPYRTYRASDGEMAIAVGNDAQFVKFAQVLGFEEWAVDERFAQNVQRVGNRDLLDRQIEQRIAERSRAEWTADLEANGIPCGPINSVTEALGSAQTLARDMVTTVAHHTVGELNLTGVPFNMFGTPTAVRRPPPTLGQHSREVLMELGFDEAELSNLVAEGVTTVE